MAARYADLVGKPVAHIASTVGLAVAPTARLLVFRADASPHRAAVARERLPSVACGDAHLPEHVLTWKTLLPCGQTEAAVVAYLRSAAPAHLTRIDAPVEAAAHAA